MDCETFVFFSPTFFPRYGFSEGWLAGYRLFIPLFRFRHIRSLPKEGGWGKSERSRSGLSGQPIDRSMTAFSSSGKALSPGNFFQSGG